MSVFLGSDLSDLGDLLEGEECFRCAGSVRNQPFVVWVGHPGRAIVLHADCARRVGCHLIQDSREAEIATGGKAWTARGVRAVRAGLLAQEGVPQCIPGPHGLANPLTMGRHQV
jgi:hypothetical protein